MVFWVRMRVFWRFGDGGEPTKSARGLAQSKTLPRNPQVHGPNARHQSREASMNRSGRRLQPALESGDEEHALQTLCDRRSLLNRAKRLERARFIGAFLGSASRCMPKVPGLSISTKLAKPLS